MLASLTTFAHCRVSACMIDASCSGVLITAMVPMPASLSCTSGSLAIRASSRLSASIIARGVATGA